MVYAEYAIDFVKQLCQKHGPRISSTEPEKLASEDIEIELKKYCDVTYLDDFQVYSTFYPGGFIRIAAIFIIAAMPFLLMKGFWPLLGTFLPLFGLFIVFASLFGMKYWFAHGFQKGTSYNATGRIFPQNAKGEKVEPKARVIVAGHTDSAFQMKITDYGDDVYKKAVPGFVFIGATIILGIILTIYNSISSKILIQKGIFSLNYINLIFLAYCIVGIPSFIFLIKGLTGGTPVEGANDNLSGTGVALALGKYFTEEEHRLENVELWIGSFGSEECGERGSHAFVKRYGAQGLLNIGHAIIPDSAGVGDRMTIITQEKMHFAKHSKEVTDRMYQGYLKYQKEFTAQHREDEVMPCEVKALPFAASDAGRFSLGGYKAGSLIVFEGELMKPAHWHAIDDVAENLEPRVMTATSELIKNYVLILEEELNHRSGNATQIRIADEFGLDVEISAKKTKNEKNRDASQEAL